MDRDTIKYVRLGLYFGGLHTRGLLEGDDLNEEIRMKMEELGIEEQEFHDVRELVYSFSSFGDCVRAAERKKRSIIKFVGEDLPE